MINRETFSMNYEIFDKEIVKEIIDIYIQEYPIRMKNIKQYIADNKLEELYKEAHSLKGVTTNFFDEDTVELARQLESKSKENDNSGLEEIYDELLITSQKLIDELEVLGQEYS